MKQIIISALALGALVPNVAHAQDMAGMDMEKMGDKPMVHHGAPAPARRHTAATDHTLPPLPANLPEWLFNKKKNEIFYKRGSYNYAIYNIKPLALDLNAVAVGHAMAYEDLVTGKAARLETETFKRIDQVLKHPPQFMPDEANLSPTFGRKYGVLEQVFDWTHVLHAQTFDVLASARLSDAQKDREIERLWQFYFSSVPYAVSPLPMNMEWLDSQPYSGEFRRKYPKINGLFWGYHWLQGAVYDNLSGLHLAQQKKLYDVVGAQYRDVELYKTNRLFMPMFAEVSPNFAARFPHIANAFDNLHMLHDMVNDILASDWMTEKQKDQQITRAIWLVSAQAHQGEKPGDFDPKNGQHDHRFMEGMAGMGLMPGGSTQVMYMAGQGWMSMDECHHCSMGFPDGADSWKVSSVSSQGWTMRVRCPLCARDMSRELKGSSVFRIPLETPEKTLVVFADDAGNLTTDTPDVVFLEEPGNHAKCNEWSQAFSSRAAFDAWVKANPKYAKEKPLSFAQWADKDSEGTPDTYVKPEAPQTAASPDEVSKDVH